MEAVNSEDGGPVGLQVGVGEFERGSCVQAPLPSVLPAGGVRGALEYSSDFIVLKLGQITG